METFFSKKLTKTTPTSDDDKQMKEDSSLTNSNLEIPSEVARNLHFDNAKEKSVGFISRPGPSSEKITSADFSTSSTSEYDIGVFIEKTGHLDDFTKEMILLHHWNPPQGYNFPSSIQKGSGGKIWHRRPNLELFTKFPWLVFSKSQQGLFCRHCPLFLPGFTAGGVSLQKLVVKPVTDFRKLLGKDGCLIQHQNHLYHKKAVEAGKEFLVRVQSPQHCVRNLQDKGHLKQVEENRKMLSSMVKCILFLGKQNIPLRSHRDDGSIVKEIQTQNEGNFRELVRFRIESGDENLSKHLESACTNAMYSSKTIQNELINCCGNEVRDVIIERIKAAKYYSILFDETTDAAHESQITFSTRYCYEGNVYEDFLDFVDPRNTIQAVEEEDDPTNSTRTNEPSLTGEVLGSTVLKLMKKNNLDLENCVGIASDGCSCMVSEVKGAVNAVQRYAVNATHCPCLNHALNLTLTKASKIQDVRNAVDTMKTVIAFFTASPKRNSVLKQKLSRQLIGLCQTRWVERHDSVHLFCSSLPKFHEALEVVSTWKETKAATKALSLSICISTSAFLVSLASLADILAITLPLSRLLQKKMIDQKEGSDAIKSTCSAMEQRRSTCEEYFHDVYLIATGLAEDIDTKLSLPRIARRQKNRPNPDIDDPEKFYRTTIYIPILDKILKDIKDRFGDDTMKLFELSVLIPTSVVEMTPKDLRESAKVLFCKFQFAVGNISSLNAAVFSNEVALWQSKWLNEKQKKKNEDIPDTGIETLTKCDKEVYPAIYELIKIFSTLPVSTATAERSFSTLRRLKDWMRTTMREDRLVALALLNIHRGIADKVDPNKVVDRFAKVKKRKLDFIL